MQFLVLGYDGSDNKALERRMAVREDHLAESQGEQYEAWCQGSIHSKAEITPRSRSTKLKVLTPKPDD